VHDVSLDVASGEVVGLLGPNGAGKTTCFYMIVGLVAADGGKIELDGENLSRLAIHQRARRGLSYLPQEASIFRKLTVAENVRAILELQDLDPDTLSNRLDALLEDLSISHLADAPAVSLSGGERRRLRNRARTCNASALHPARRAVRGGGSYRRARYPAHHRVSQGARHRRPHHRSQRAGDARHLRPRLHHQRGPGARVRRARGYCL
jgi:ABC-type hemin transport system ATPase subunit